MIQSKRFVVVAVAMACVLMLAGAAWSQKGDAKPGWLGVTIQDVDDDLRDALPRGSDDGVLISDVAEDSPADRAGLREGDVITRFNRETIEDTGDLTRAVREAGAGNTVFVEYYRNGRQMRDRVTLGERELKLGWLDEDDADRRFWVDDEGNLHKLEDGEHKIIIERKSDEPGVVIWEDEDGVQKKLKDGRKRVILKRHGSDDDDFMVWHDADEGEIVLKELQKGHELRALMDKKGKDLKLRFGGPGNMKFFVGDRPKLGVMLTDLGDQLAEYFGASDGGALISEVVEDSPAEKAGIKAGDVITRIDGEPVEDAGDVSKMLRKAEAGDHVKVDVLRKGRSTSFDVEIEESESSWYSGDAFVKPDLDRYFDVPKPRVRKYEMFAPRGDDMKSEMDELRKELQQLRKELSELKSRRP